MRKITSISASDQYMVVVCDDNTMWVRGSMGGRWTRLPDIPQDDAMALKTEQWRKVEATMIDLVDEETIEVIKERICSDGDYGHQ